MIEIPFATYHLWKNTEIHLEFYNKLSEEAISSIINNGFALNFEYLLSQEKNESVIKYLAGTPTNAIRYVHVFINDTGFELMVSSRDNYSLVSLSDFADFFTTRADYDECDQLVFDSIKYLEIVTFLFKNLVVKKIRLIENSEAEHSVLPEPISNSVSVLTGATYYFRSPYQYIVIILNNIKQSGGTFANNFMDINESSKHLADQLSNNEEEGILLSFILDNDNLELKIYPQYLILKPVSELITVKENNNEFVDISYYTQVMMLICKNLGIRDLETYFD